MNDITKCMNKECPIKNQCLRYTIESSSKWQSYSFLQCREINPLYATQVYLDSYFIPNTIIKEVK